jgi:hypothetical protein
VPRQPALPNKQERDGGVRQRRARSPPSGADCGPFDNTFQSTRRNTHRHGGSDYGRFEIPTLPVDRLRFPESVPGLSVEMIRPIEGARLPRPGFGGRQPWEPQPHPLTLVMDQWRARHFTWWLWFDASGVL